MPRLVGAHGEGASATGSLRVARQLVCGVFDPILVSSPTNSMLVFPSNRKRIAFVENTGEHFFPVEARAGIGSRICHVPMADKPFEFFEFIGALNGKGQRFTSFLHGVGFFQIELAYKETEQRDKRLVLAFGVSVRPQCSTAKFHAARLLKLVVVHFSFELFFGQLPLEFFGQLFLNKRTISDLEFLEPTESVSRFGGVVVQSNEHAVHVDPNASGIRVSGMERDRCDIRILIDVAIPIDAEVR